MKGTEDMEELVYASATALARVIREKQVSSQEVVESFSGDKKRPSI